MFSQFFTEHRLCYLGTAPEVNSNSFELARGEKMISPQMYGEQWEMHKDALYAQKDWSEVRTRVNSTVQNEKKYAIQKGNGFAEILTRFGITAGLERVMVLGFLEREQGVDIHNIPAGEVFKVIRREGEFFFAFGNGPEKPLFPDFFYRAPESAAEKVATAKENVQQETNKYLDELKLKIVPAENDAALQEQTAATPDPSVVESPDQDAIAATPLPETLASEKAEESPSQREDQGEFMPSEETRPPSQAEIIYATPEITLPPIRPDEEIAPTGQLQEGEGVIPAEPLLPQTMITAEGFENLQKEKEDAGKSEASSQETALEEPQPPLPPSSQTVEALEEIPEEESAEKMSFVQRVQNTWQKLNPFGRRERQRKENLRAAGTALDKLIEAGK